MPFDMINMSKKGSSISSCPRLTMMLVAFPMQLSIWHEWQAADDKQLNSHFNSGTIGMAVPHLKKDPLTLSQVFRLHWAH